MSIDDSTAAAMPDDDFPADAVRAGYGVALGSEFVEIAPKLTLPTPMRIDVENWDGYDLFLILALVDGSYRCRELRVIQREEGPEVSRETLRSVPVATFMRASRQVAAYPVDLRAMGQRYSVRQNREVIQWVAAVYRLAYATGNPPKQEVAERFGISPATAGRWIARARHPEYGFLEPATEPGRAGI